MDHRDFLNALSAGRFPSNEAAEYFSELRKNAGAKELLSGGAEVLSKHKAPLIGAAVGAATATALQYLANKPGKSGKSRERMATEQSLAGHEKNLAESQSQGKEPGFSQQLAHIRARQAAEIAKLNEKHPARGALLAAPLGAVAGSTLAGIAKKFTG